jgi:glycosyltransferase involved in cell wall biosynthesis
MAGLTPAEVCVLLPAYNEAASVVRVAEGVRALGYPVFVSDDGSTDGSAEKLRAATVPHLTAAANAGKGAALRRAFAWFLERPYRAAVLMDSDGQHDAADLGAFLRALDSGADLVIGDRLAAPAGMPWLRRATNRTMSGLLSGLTRQRVPDSQCGYRAVSRRFLERADLRCDRYEIESEMILEAARLGFQICSVPVRCVYLDGRSHIRPWRDTRRFLRFLAAYWLRRRNA